METLPIVLASLLALAFVAAGARKLFDAEQAREDLVRLGLPGRLTAVIAAVELIAAAALIVAIVRDDPSLAAAAAAVLGITMVGAVAAHVRARDTVAHIAPAAIFGLLAASVVVLV